MPTNSAVITKALGLNSASNQIEAPEGSFTEASNVIIRRNNVVESRRGFQLYGAKTEENIKQLMLYKEKIIRHKTGPVLELELIPGSGNYSTFFKAYKFTNNGTTLEIDNGSGYVVFTGNYRYYPSGSVLEVDDGSGNFIPFSGNHIEPESGLRIKSIEANKNLYFTGQDGIQKISALSSDSLIDSTDSGGCDVKITRAGGVKALDFRADLVMEQGSQTGIIGVDSAVAYRVLWSVKDNSDNLIRGTPSPKTDVFNPFSTLLIKDFIKICQTCDAFSGGLITDKNYTTTFIGSNVASQLSINSSPTEIKTIIGDFCTKIDKDIYLASEPSVNAGSAIDIDSVVVANSTCTIGFNPSGTPSQLFKVGDRIELTGFVLSGSTKPLDGFYQIVTVSDSPKVITFSTTASDGNWFVGPAFAGKVFSYNFRYIYNTDETGSTASSLKETYFEDPVDTNSQKIIQTTLSRIIGKLQNFSNGIIPSSQLPTELIVTEGSGVQLEVIIPKEVIDAYNSGVYYFVQIYRSLNINNISISPTPSDELKLAYEAFPTDSEITAKTMRITDITPDSLLGANLYTNEATGEGILQANEPPPFAKDINLFKNSLFFANTKTKHKKIISLTGVSEILKDYNNSRNPQLLIHSGTTTTVYTFIKGIQQITPVSFVVGSIANLSYFNLYVLKNKKYTIWFNTIGGVQTAPTVSGTDVYVEVKINGLNNDQTALAVNNAMSLYIEDFNLVHNLNTVTFTNIKEGVTTAPFSSTVGVSFGAITSGAGEDSSTRKILLSSLTSVSQAIDETARSLVRVINSNSDEILYAYYISSVDSIPGKFLLENKSAGGSQFYVTVVTTSADNKNSSGSSFNPDLTPDCKISVMNSTTDEIRIIKTKRDDGSFDAISPKIGDTIVVFNNNITSNNGTTVIKKVTQNTAGYDYTIQVSKDIPVGSNPVGFVEFSYNVEASDNEEKVNRIYYSKPQEPEAVPLANFFDVGQGDRKIIRIMPLRDSLFVFKEDGVFRISGESTPYSSTLFDSTCTLIAPDSVAVTNNMIHLWGDNGVQVVSENGIDKISDPINTDILLKSSPSYVNFSKITWGIGYESDSSYILFTNLNPSDSYATMAYRYSELTRTWTTWDKNATCGIINTKNDKLYLASSQIIKGDRVSFLEVERKNLDRTDYADHEEANSISTNQYSNGVLKLSSLENISLGDIITQDQYLSIYNFNMLLKKLDIDPGVAGNDYFSSLQMFPGENLRLKLVELANKLDLDSSISYSSFTNLIEFKSGFIGPTYISQTDPVVFTYTSHGLVSGRYVTISGGNTINSVNGNYSVTVLSDNTFSIPVNVINTGINTLSFTTQIDTFQDLRACYNAIVSKLNSDGGVGYSDYQLITDNNLLETSISKIDYVSNKIYLNNSLDFVVGPITIYKSIPITITYSPLTMGDPLNSKQLRESTVMFESKAFTKAKVGFSTDLFPEFDEIEFDGDGSGIFGNSKFGHNFFGGSSNAAPFRTYIPKQAQRCRFIQVKISHNTAREKISIFGISLTGRIGISPRAYRK